MMLGVAGGMKSFGLGGYGERLHWGEKEHLENAGRDHPGSANFFCRVQFKSCNLEKPLTHARKSIPSGSGRDEGIVEAVSGFEKW
jgi:hypothetical protein